MNVSQLKLITLDNLYETSEESGALDLFSEIIRLRVEGYKPDHSPRLLPFDPIDFNGRHHLVVIQEGDQIQVLGGIKHIQLSVCDYYNMRIPLLNAAYMVSASTHIQVIEALHEQHRQSGRELIYSGHFTISKAVRADRAITQSIKELLIGMTYSDFLEFETKTITCAGALRFKTDLLFDQMGFQRIQSQGIPLDPIGLVHDPKDQMVFMAMETPSKMTIECHKKHLGLIQSRRVIQAGSIVPQAYPLKKVA